MERWEDRSLLVVGNGLEASYFTNTTLPGPPALTRVDPNLNADWVQTPPSAEIGPYNFSGRWTGQIEPRYSEACTFTVISDDGVRVWFNGQLVVNNWTEHAPAADSFTANLTAGQHYDLVVEYHANHYGSSVTQLLWSSASQAEEPIPTAQLYAVPVNRPPLLTNPGPQSHAEGASVSLQIEANDDAGGLTFTASGLPAGLEIGSSTGLIAGVISCTAAQTNGGSYPVTVTATDSNGASSSQTFAWTVADTNQPPVAVADAATTDEDTPVDILVLVNDSDADNDPLTVTLVTGPASGTATGEDNGTPADPSDDFIRYTPAANFNGSDSLTCQIDDGRGGSATATVALTVNPVNDAPQAVDDSATTDEDTPTSIYVPANDNDADNDPLTVLILTSPDHGTATVEDTGTPDDASDDIVWYRPHANFNGSDSLTYQVNDGHGGVNTASVTIAVTPVNDTPLTVPDLAMTDTNTAIDIAVLANDSDVENDPLVIGVLSASVQNLLRWCLADHGTGSWWGYPNRSCGCGQGCREASSTQQCLLPAGVRVAVGWDCSRSDSRPPPSLARWSG